MSEMHQPAKDQSRDTGAARSRSAPGLPTQLCPHLQLLFLARISNLAFYENMCTFKVTSK